VVKGVLHGISLDYVKHAEMYSAAIKLLTSISRALTEEQLDKQRELVEKHIKIEAKLIEKISKILPDIENRKQKSKGFVKCNIRRRKKASCIAKISRKDNRSW